MFQSPLEIIYIPLIKSRSMPARANRAPNFHPSVKMEYADRSFLAGKEAGYITDSDEKIIREYVWEKAATSHISEGRQLKVFYTLIRWRIFLPAPYLDLTYADVLNGIESLKRGKNERGNPFKKNTLHDYTRILKAFLLWMIENDRIELPEKKIRKIEVIGRDYDTTEPDDLLTHDDVLKLIEVCQQARDRALISVLYESGARIGELARLQWRDLEFDQYGIKMHIRDRKGEQKRYSRLVRLSPPYLSQWREQYQAETGLDPHGQNLVFLTVKNNPLEYQTVAALFRRLVGRADMKKRVHPHLFRKSRITHMIAEGFQESVVKETMWRNPNTEMFRTYLKLSEMDIDAEFLDKAGVVRKEISVPKMPEKVVCPNCFSDNGPTIRYCWKCGHGLTKEAIKRGNDAISAIDDEIEADPDLLRDPEVLAALKLIGKKMKSKNQRGTSPRL